MAQLITWLTECISEVDSKLMPAHILDQQRAEALWLRSAGNLMTACAIEAAVQRHVASKELLETDGCVTFTSSGKANNLLKQSLDLHRRASESEKIIHAEETRLLLIQAAEKTL